MWERLIHLLTSDATLLAALCEVCEVSDAEPAAKALLSIHIHHADALRLVRASVHAEFAAHAAHPAQIFRSQSLASRVVGAHARLVGSAYLRDTLRPVVAAFLSEPPDLEIDPSRVPADVQTETLAQRQEQLGLWCELFAARLTAPSSLHDMPRQMRHALLEVQAAAEVLPDGEAQARALLGGYFFLRLFNPAIVAPEANGVVDTAPSPNGRRALLLISKTLQAAANGVEFGEKEPFMTPLNPVLQRITPSFGAFLETASMFARVPPPSDGGEPEEGAMDDSALAAQVSLTPESFHFVHGLLVRHRARLLSLLPAEHASSLLVALEELGPVVTPAATPHTDRLGWWSEVKHELYASLGTLTHRISHASTAESERPRRLRTRELGKAAEKGNAEAATSVESEVHDEYAMVIAGDMRIEGGTISALLLRVGEVGADDAEQIERDVMRAGRRELGITDDAADAHRHSLRRLLLAWCLLRPDVGYTQGLHVLAAAVLRHCDDDEEVALAALVRLLARLPDDFFGEGLHGCVAEVDALLQLFKTREPKLFAHPRASAALQESISMAATTWFLSVWVGVLPTPWLPAAWLLLLEADDANLRLGLAVLALAKHELLTLRREADAAEEGVLLAYAFEALQRAGDGTAEVRRVEAALRAQRVGAAEASAAREAARARLREAAAAKAARRRAAARPPCVHAVWGGMEARGRWRTRAAEEGIAMLQAGVEVTKYGQAGGAHAATLSLSADEGVLAWERVGWGKLVRKAAPREVQLCDAVELLIGQGAGGHLSLSLVLRAALPSTPAQIDEAAARTPRERQTLNVAFGNLETFGPCVAALRALVASAHSARAHVRELEVQSLALQALVAQGDARAGPGGLVGMTEAEERELRELQLHEAEQGAAGHVELHGALGDQEAFQYCEECES